MSTEWCARCWIYYERSGCLLLLYSSTHYTLYTCTKHHFVECKFKSLLLHLRAISHSIDGIHTTISANTAIFLVCNNFFVFAFFTVSCWLWKQLWMSRVSLQHVTGGKKSNLFRYRKKSKFNRASHVHLSDSLNDDGIRFIAIFVLFLFLFLYKCIIFSGLSDELWTTYTCTSCTHRAVECATLLQQYLVFQHWKCDLKCITTRGWETFHNNNGCNVTQSNNTHCDDNTHLH